MDLAWLPDWAVITWLIWGLLVNSLCRKVESMCQLLGIQLVNNGVDSNFVKIPEPEPSRPEEYWNPVLVPVWTRLRWPVTAVGLGMLTILGMRWGWKWAIGWWIASIFVGWALMWPGLWPDQIQVFKMALSQMKSYGLSHRSGNLAADATFFLVMKGELERAMGLRTDSVLARLKTGDGNPS